MKQFPSDFFVVEDESIKQVSIKPLKPLLKIYVSFKNTSNEKIQLQEEENILTTEFQESTLEEKMSKLINEKHLKSELQTYTLNGALPKFQKEVCNETQTLPQPRISLVEIPLSKKLDDDFFGQKLEQSSSHLSINFDGKREEVKRFGRYQQRNQEQRHTFNSQGHSNQLKIVLKDLNLEKASSNSKNSRENQVSPIRKKNRLQSQLVSNELILESNFIDSKKIRRKQQINVTTIIQCEPMACTPRSSRVQQQFQSKFNRRKKQQAEDSVLMSNNQTENHNHKEESQLSIHTPKSILKSHGSSLSIQSNSRLSISSLNSPSSKKVRFSLTKKQARRLKK